MPCAQKDTEAREPAEEAALNNTPGREDTCSERNYNVQQQLYALKVTLMSFV
jgi:hypothetical protein